MTFDPPLLPGKLLRRYKRFLADVELENGEIVVAHSPNTGSMLGVSDPGSRIWMSYHPDPKRKTHYTWELTQVGNICVGVNTARSNALVLEVLESGTLEAFRGYSRIEREVRYGSEHSRIDLLLKGEGLPDCYVEVKNVTAVDENGAAIFPDAVTLRGQKHMRELARMVDAGHRAVVAYTIQRSDAKAFRPADEIDPNYGKALREAVAAGVKVLPLQFDATPQAITFRKPLAFLP